MTIVKIDSFDSAAEYKFLSNMYPAPCVAWRLEFSCSEAMYQAAKCANQEDRAQFADINGYRAKRLGKNVTLRLDWPQVKETVMEECLRMKFWLGGTHAEWLLDTEGATLEEGNTWGDVYWGTVNGVGENRLGILLMKRRDELRVLEGK